MTEREKIIALAKQAEIIPNLMDENGYYFRHIEAFYRKAQREAFEQAAHTCERLISGDGICASDEVWIHDCAEAIRQLIKE